MRTATEATKAMLRCIKLDYDSWRMAAQMKDPDNWNATLGAMSDAWLDKPMSLERENALRAVFGYPLLPRVEEKQVCPIHDVVHDCACDGKQGQAVWVHPKEKLVKAPGFGKPRKERKTIQLPPEAYAIMVEWRERIGGDWYETIRAMDYLAKGVTR